MPDYRRNYAPGGTFFFTCVTYRRRPILTSDLGRRWDDDYPLRWMRIKEKFTESGLQHGGAESPQTTSRMRQRYRGVWHKRYWEHTVDDESDLKRCADYVHWNPRKHELAGRVGDWPWPSFARYVRDGEYDSDWSATGLPVIPVTFLARGRQEDGSARFAPRRNAGRSPQPQ